MKIKRFAARDMTTATHLIKEEFGLSAIILSQRELSPEEGGGVEITAGVKDEDLPTTREQEPTNPREQEPPKAKEQAPPKNPPRSKTGQAAGVAAYRQAEHKFSPPAPPPDITPDLHRLEQSLLREIGELKNLILDLAHRQNLAEKWRGKPNLVHLYRRLVETGLPSEAARSLVELAAESSQAWGGEINEHLRRALRPKLRLIDLSISPPKALALVGPSGAGKTTALVNLATFYRQRGLRVATITLDTLRLGAAEQLTQYARILGLGVRVCQNHEEFKEALDLFENDDIILIDTPGRNFQKTDGRQELLAYFSEAKAAALLVLPAGMKEDDFTAALSKGRGMAEAGLVLTKLDETESLGPLLGFLMACTPRLAFFSMGAKTSEEFTLASPDKLLDLWLGPVTQETQENKEGH